MKYLLKQNKEDKGILCDKVTINGLDYYVSDEKPSPKDWFVNLKSKALGQHNGAEILLFKEDKKVIATNNPSIDIPKVVNEVEVLAKNAYIKHSVKDDKLSLDEQIQRSGGFIVGYKEGYNKSQETHPFSEKDMIDFAEFINENEFIQYADKLWSSILIEYSGCLYTTKELLKLWKEQQPKVLYYE